MDVLGKVLLKDHDSKNSKYKQARTGDIGDPIGSPNFCWYNVSLNWKKH